jgi:GntP family gluconate:H+ symporter
LNIWLLLSLAIISVLVTILWLRLHPFLALLLAGWIVAIGTPAALLQSHAETLVLRGNLSSDEVDTFVNRPAVKRLADAFGKTAGQIGILIALASILGACLAESGAARRIVDGALACIGERHAAFALAFSSFLLGIPIYFDTVFYLMVPLARSLRARSGKDYVYYILAIMAGGSIAHSLIPPTPGPLQVAEIIGVDLVTLIFVGSIVGGCSSLFSLMAAWTINRFVEVPLRDFQSEPLAESKSTTRASGPPLLFSVLPITIPILLIGGDAAFKLWLPGTYLSWCFAAVGEKNTAIGIGTAVALWLMTWAPETSKTAKVVADALSNAGTIILITCSGGAFGIMLGQSGVAESLSLVQSQVPGLMLLVVAFLLTAAIRTLQGSATVAMITAAGILQGFASSDTLPFHPVYLVLAIGGGSKPVSWMNDSGFWVMCRMSGMTESEGLKTVSPLTIAMGLSTLFWTLVAAWLFPMQD